MATHTILGAGGTIGNLLCDELLQHGHTVRLVSRNPKPVAGATTMSADMTDASQVLQAVQGSDVVYLLVGLQYSYKVWRVQWPQIMNHVIAACKATGAKLIFFDNVYMYGRVDGPMTEATPFAPCSKKGEVRAAIASQLLREMEAGTIKALIARSADFYGPHADKTSLLNILVFQNMQKGKKAQWLGNADKLHSFTHVGDAAKALYLLAQRDDAWGQQWHLPTSAERLTPRQLIGIAAGHMHASYKVMSIPSWMVKCFGLFNPLMKEMGEMAYQNDHDYIFDSTKFNKAFNFTPTSYEEGLRQSAHAMQQIRQ